MTKKEIQKFFTNAKAKFYEEEPKIGDYFGIIEDIYSVIPYHGDTGELYFECSSPVEDDNPVDIEPLLFKKIDDETAIEISTGFQVILNPKYDFKDISNLEERFKIYAEKERKYRKICLQIENCDYIIPNDEFKKVYGNVLRKGNEDLNVYLNYLFTRASEQYEEERKKISNDIHSIALADNAIYDAEKKYKVNTLTKQDDELN